MATQIGPYPAQMITAVNRSSLYPDQMVDQHLETTSTARNVSGGPEGELALTEPGFSQGFFLHSVEAYTSDTVSIEQPSDVPSASRSEKHWLFRPSTNEA